MQKVQAVITVKQNEMFYVSQRRIWGLLLSFMPFQPFLFTLFFLPTETFIFPPECLEQPRPSRAPLLSAAQLLSKIRENGADLLWEGLRDGHRSQISPFPSSGWVFLAVPWFSLGLLCPGVRRMLQGLRLLLLQVLHPPTPSPVLQPPGL